MTVNWLARNNPLRNLGHEVMTVDNYIKRHWEDIVNVKPLINLKPLKERV